MLFVKHTVIYLRALWRFEMAGMYDSGRGSVWRNPASGGFYPESREPEEEVMPSDPFGESEEDTFSATDVARLLRAANAPDPDDGEEEMRDLVMAAEPPPPAASLAPPAPRRRKKKKEMPSHGQWEVQIRQGRKWGWLASFYGPPPDKDRIRERFGSGEFRIVEQASGWSASFTIAHSPNGASQPWAQTSASESHRPSPSFDERPVEEVVAETVSTVVPAAVNEAISGLMQQFEPLLAGFLQKDDSPDEDPRVAMMERELEMTRQALAQVHHQQQAAPSSGSDPIMAAVMEKVVSAGLDNLGVSEKEEETDFVSQALRAATAMFEMRAASAANAPPPPPQIAAHPVQRPSLAGMTPEIEGELRQHAARLGLDYNDAMIEAQKAGLNAQKLLTVARSQ
jgi:hypothetical protein